MIIFTSIFKDNRGNNSFFLNQLETRRNLNDMIVRKILNFRENYLVDYLT